MAIDLSTVGHSVEPHSKSYDWRDVSLYAQALGAGTGDLKYVLDPSPQVLPTWGVIPAFEPVFDAMRATGGDLVQLLHTAQRTELVRPFPAAGEMKTRARIRGIWDMKIGAICFLDTETEVDSELACRTSWQLLVRGAGGFGGERPPGSLRTKPPRGAEPDFEVEVETSADQALLYRLTGDVNPIHSHPEVAAQAGFDRPILHGLCTYGIAGRVALKALAGDEPARFKALETRFNKVVMPGDTLVVRGYKLEAAGQAAVTVTVKASGDVAIANGLFEYAP
ncbi:MAG: MaoC/PaaZ C-terminal domain-containing protein [Myxococcales bacterium]|nr:MaoC/PaaZ C-terminal domain-containing protein [Myxococcales bacterium]